MSARILAAIAVLVSAYVHYYEWHSGMRYVHVIGPLFIVNIVAGIVIAVALGVRDLEREQSELLSGTDRRPQGSEATGCGLLDLEAVLVPIADEPIPRVRFDALEVVDDDLAR